MLTVYEPPTFEEDSLGPDGFGTDVFGPDGLRPDGLGTAGFGPDGPDGVEDGFGPGWFGPDGLGPGWVGIVITEVTSGTDGMIVEETVVCVVTVIRLVVGNKVSGYTGPLGV